MLPQIPPRPGEKEYALVAVTTSARTRRFFEFSLCLSRACLDKIVYGIKQSGCKNGVFRTERRLDLPGIHRPKKNGTFKVFPMFVPGLSWQNDDFYITTDKKVEADQKSSSIFSPVVL